MGLGYIFTIFFMKNSLKDIFPKIPKDLENEFSLYFNKIGLSFFKLSVIAVFFISLFFVLLDYFMLPYHWKTVWIIRFFTLELPLFLGFYIAFNKKMQNKLVKIFQFFGIYFIVSSGLGISAMIYISDKTELAYNFYFIGLMLIMVASIIFFLRTKNTIISTVFVLTLYILLILFRQKLHTENISLLINNLIFVFSMSYAIIVSSLIIEGSVRKSFLAEKALLLEKEKVEENLNEIRAQKEEIELQQKIIAEKHRQLTDSINYAFRIQNLILPEIEEIRPHFEDLFVLFLPKQTVSGDFFWKANLPDGQILLAVADSTGHGVPGAFMSIIGNNILNEAVFENNLKEPREILKYLSEKIYKIIRYKGGQIRDGMDISLIKYDKKNLTLEFSISKQEIILFKGEQMNVFKGSKIEIGDNKNNFDNYPQQMVKVESGDVLYMFSDGYPDQLGYVKNKPTKFMLVRFRDFLKQMRSLPLRVQKEKLEQELEDWKNGFVQTDDITVLGVMF